MSREEQALINEVISSEFGLYFPDTKRQILQSRLEPRLRELRLRRFYDYYLKLQYDLASEKVRLISLLTNNETYFHREKAQFHALFDVGLEQLVAEAPVPGKVRILSAGCSSGEEPYTLNIYAKERRFRLAGSTVSIEAFDIDHERLELARRAEFGSRSLRVTSAERRQRYFRPLDDNRFQLKAPFRDGVKFRFGNIVDPGSYPGAHNYDVVFCRNVLIYFSEIAMRRAIDNFARALRPGGLLFLGHSESIIGMTPLLETVRLGSCIVYRRAPL